MSDKILEVKNLKKYYYVAKSFFSQEKIEIRAVDGLDFSLNESSTLAVVGESGCGKTTLAKIILKLIEPDSGEITFGPAIDNLRKDVQMVFQNPYNSLDPLMNIGDIILEPLLIQGIGNARNRVCDLLKLVRLDEKARNRFPGEFSGGERQRISLARALATEPKIIILDEPVSSLDVRIQEQILKLLKDLQLKLGLSFLFITHNFSVVKNFCDFSLVMYLGKIMEYCSSRDLFEKPMHPFSESLLLASREKKTKLKADLPRFEIISGCIFNTRCPYAQDKCFKIEPKLEEKEDNHLAYCHFPIKKSGV